MMVLDGWKAHVISRKLRLSRTICGGISLLIIVRSVMPAWSETGGLILPTENNSLYTGGGPSFYQYVERDFQGRKSRPWQGGQYGFVRNPRETAAGIVFSRFHEGIDIRPVRRDANGEPLDPVRAVADGRVVYVTQNARASGYGIYAVVEHLWGGCPYYTLYAHLASVAVSAGQQVTKGEKIGVMGYTGRGLDRVRAHLHFEVNLLLSSDFEAWHQQWFPNDPNEHGIYNGLNLVGIDAAGFLLANRQPPGVGVGQFLANKETYYKVVVPKRGRFELIERYPWMLEGDSSVGGWEISFHASGLPLRVRAVPRPVEPVVSWVKPSRAPHSLQTRNWISGTGSRASLTETGLKYLDLLLR